MIAPLLLTGATGNTGAEIAKALMARGIPFVALARSQKNRDILASRGITAVAGDFDDPASLEAPLKGIKAAYLVSTPDETLVARETAFITAAKKAGVERIVKCSAYLSERSSDSPNLRSHALIEAALAESGMEWTVLRPHGFMQTFTLFSWDLIQKVGVISAPHGNGAMALVDVRDVAAVAVKAMTEPGHNGRIYDVTGPEALTMWDMAEILGRVLGREVSYVEGSERSMRMAMNLLGVPETPLQHVMVVARLVRENKLARVHPTLTLLAGASLGTGRA